MSDQYSEEHTCSWVDHTDGKALMQKWEVKHLWKAARWHAPFDLDIDRALKKCGGWTKHLSDLAHPLVAPELKRIEGADLQYPIILHPTGWVMDGYHRIAKAYLVGHKTIRAVRFTEGSLPLPIMEIPDYESRPHLF